MTNALFIWNARDTLRAHLADALADRPDIRLVFPDETDEETLVRLAPTADVMIGWRPSQSLLDAAANLRLFINPGVGVQHLIEQFGVLAESRPVLLANGHGNTYFTAQHTVALLLALTNKVVPHHNWMQAGEWRKGDAAAKSIPMRDRHVGLLGYGAVNQHVHRMLSGFDVRFSMLRRAPTDDYAGSSADASRPGQGAEHMVGENLASPARALERTYGPEQLDQFVDAVDVLIVAVPLTAETDGLIGEHELALLGESGLLVNVGRGAVVDEGALFGALESGRIAGAAIDVWYEYSPDATSDGGKHPYDQLHPFHELDNVVLSPHRAASPFDDLRRWDEVIENLRRLADGRDDLLNLVNLQRGY